MHVRITRARFEMGLYDELVRISQELATAFQRQPGFQGCYNGLSRDTGVVVSVSLWDTEEHAQLDRAALGDLIVRIQSVGVQMESADVAEIYEVTAHLLADA